MKKIKALIAALFVLCSSSLFADDFDWSQCWCNYGAGIKQGDKLLSVDFGIDYDYVSLIGNGYWGLPTAVVDFEIAQPIWKLPFTFGGYAGYRLSGYKNDDLDLNIVSSTLYFGGTAAYHVQLPPKNLDVYVATKLGFWLGLTNADKEFKEYAPKSFWIDIGEVMGASWYFNDSFGINLELGYPINKFGIIFKF